MAANGALYPTPCVPPGRGLVVVISSAGKIVIEKSADPVAFPLSGSVAVTVKVGPGTAVAPSEPMVTLPSEFSVKPEGSEPAVTAKVQEEHGLPLSVAENDAPGYATPTSPFGVDPETTTCPHAAPAHPTATTTAPAHLNSIRIMKAPGSG